MVSFDKLTNLLKGADITPSVQRIKVLEYLFNCKIHPTADRIYKALKDQSAGISLATVYNTLKLFEDLVDLSLGNPRPGVLDFKACGFAGP